MFMDNVADLGAMGPGDYFWRDPWVTHGPMRTKGGFIALLRHDRHHVNYFIDQTGTTPEENRALVESGHFDGVTFNRLIGREEQVDLFEAMRTQRSVKRYKPDPVSDDDIRRILTAATWAPNGANAQPWEFIVIRDPS